MALFKKSIELDCAPGCLRPSDLIAGVIKGTGLDLRETVYRFFGLWEWDYSDVSDEKWKEIQPVLEERITVLYNSGEIRYGSW